MKLQTLTILMLSLLSCIAADAQRGMPLKAKTRSVLATKYPQHLDFLPAMVKLIKVPEGWEVSELSKPYFI